MASFRDPFEAQEQYEEQLEYLQEARDEADESFEQNRQNAREDFEEFIEYIPSLSGRGRTPIPIRCAWVSFDRDLDDARYSDPDFDVTTEPPRIFLKEGFTPDDYQEFLQKIDRDYDRTKYEGLQGFIWLVDGSICHRVLESDSEYPDNVVWRRVITPEIPLECYTIPSVKSSGKV